MKPRIFVSSTFYDLKYIRNDLENFIQGYGFEPVLFESNGITFKKEEKIDDSCYREIGNCHMMVLIIGGRYGTPASSEKQDYKEKYKEFTSITLKEYRTAVERKMPIYVFVDRNVEVEYSTYKKNGLKESVIDFAFADDINVYNFVHEVYGNGNYVFSFDNFQDIRQTLKDQWAGLMYEYLFSLRSISEVANIKDEINRLHSISEKINVAVEGLVDKVLAEDTEKKAEINNRQHEFDYEGILKLFKRLFVFYPVAGNYDKKGKENLVSIIIEQFNSSKELPKISSLKTIEGIGHVERDSNIASSLHKQIRNMKSQEIESLSKYLVQHFDELEMFPF